MLPFIADFFIDSLLGFLTDGKLLAIAVLGIFSLFSFCQWPMIKTNGQQIFLFSKKVLFCQHKKALVVIGFLYNVFLVIRCSNLELHPSFLPACAKLENVRGVILGGLDVILVGVRPVQLDLFPVVRD